MNNYSLPQLSSTVSNFIRIFKTKNKVIISGLWFSLILIINLLVRVNSAQAHHPLDGKIPSNFIEGFLSGLGHPVIGIDHLAFVAAIGLLAALKNKLGMLIPVGFIVATALGTGIHLMSLNLPIPEVIISASILVMGFLLARRDVANLGLIIMLATISGVFHGYAYGESIVGAEMTPLGAYLLGFSFIQLLISAIAFNVGQWLLPKNSRSTNLHHLSLRFAGFAISGIGFAFLSSTILG